MHTRFVYEGQKLVCTVTQERTVCGQVRTHVRWNDMIFYIYNNF